MEFGPSQRCTVQERGSRQFTVRGIPRNLKKLHNEGGQTLRQTVETPRLEIFKTELETQTTYSTLEICPTSSRQLQYSSRDPFQLGLLYDKSHNALISLDTAPVASCYSSEMEKILPCV